MQYLLKTDAEASPSSLVSPPSNSLLGRIRVFFFGVTDVEINALVRIFSLIDRDDETRREQKPDISNDVATFAEK